MIFEAVIHSNGIAHLYEDGDTANFPLCADSKTMPAVGVEKRADCQWCREAHSRIERRK